MDSNTRKLDVLKTVIETFVHTNQPVGSMQVVEQLPYEVSSATVRNDLVELTEFGLLKQPHTSAGRVPTDEGYRHYVKVLAGERQELSRRQREALAAHFAKLQDLQAKYRKAAELLAEISGNVGFLMDDARNVYMSGLRNAARMPEFEDARFRANLLEALEQPESLMNELANNLVSEHPNVIVGNPRMHNTAIVVSNFGPTGKRVISIIGPSRMQYRKALPLVEYMKELLDEI